MDGSGPGARAVEESFEERRASRTDRLCAGTLACRQCDAPIAIGSEPRSLRDHLSCPFCHHGGPLRDFLSLTAPTRPARVVIRVTRPAVNVGPRRAPGI
jgi:hypothetical protein